MDRKCCPVFMTVFAALDKPFDDAWMCRGRRCQWWIRVELGNGASIENCAMVVNALKNVDAKLTV